MSVLIVAKFRETPPHSAGHSPNVPGEFEKIGDTARAAGGIHHRFGVGDGFVVVVDEWESVEHFQQFFGNPELQAFSVLRAPPRLRRK
jgi:hypothetical protein